MLRVSNKVVITLILFLFMISSCAREDNFNSEQVVPIEKNGKISGENLFRQVFFLQGGKSNILSSIPSYSYNIEKINKLNIQQKGSSERYINEIIKIIKENNLDYFRDFGIKMSSKDPYLIDQTLKNSTQDILTAIEVLSGNNKEYKAAMKIYNEKYGSISLNTDKDLETLIADIEKDLKAEMYQKYVSNVPETEQAPGTEQGVALAAVLVVAAVGWETVATVNMVAAVTAFVWKYGKFFGATESAKSSSLTNDEVVAVIVNNY